ncbi:MAG: hypothetical protein Q7S40_22895 [Opitutaceae bacterium]|nr:hypothetical protein [Opitutaceae bacterium]
MKAPSFRSGIMGGTPMLRPNQIMGGTPMLRPGQNIGAMPVGIHNS